MEILNGSSESNAIQEEHSDAIRLARLHLTLNAMPQSFKVQEYQVSVHIVETQKQDSLKDVMMETQQMVMDVAHHAQ